MVHFNNLKREIGVLLLLLFCAFRHADCQEMVPVDLHTGVANISIPLYVLEENDLSVPIGIYYNTSGVKVEDYGKRSPYGFNWNLQASGQVKRSMRDLPDDYNSGDLTNPLLGWLDYSTPFFTIADDGNPVTCDDESANYNYLKNLGWFGYTHDTEPDIFNFNGPGISGQFVIDRTGVARTIPYQDLKIFIQKGPQDKILSFTITTNQGYIYKFGIIKQTNTLQARPANGSLSNYYNSRQFYQTQTPLTYTTSWGLTEMISPLGSKITFSYGTNEKTGEYIIPHSIVHKISNPANSTIAANYYSKNFYDTYVSISEASLSSIVSSTKRIDFNGNITVSNISPTGALEKIKAINFNYDNTITITPSIDCTSNPLGSFKFEYYGGSVSTILPTGTKDKDFWGYFNNRHSSSLVPKVYVYYNLTGADRYRVELIPGNSQYYILDGADRRANPEVVMLGSLKQITYPTGSVVRFEYESNEYYDATAQTAIKGGGIRVKRVIYSEGSGNSPDIVKEYSYAPNSGRLTYMPTFAYPTAFYKDWYYNGSPTFVPSDKTGQDKWDYFTLRSETDLGPWEENNGSYVSYLSATEKQTGKGSIQKDFLMPGTYGELTSGADWQASFTFLARNKTSGTCFDAGIVTSGYYTYPFAPNTNYAFERGLLNKQTYFNEAGQVLKETFYTYQRINAQSTPVILTGIRSAEITNSINSYFVFAPYKIMADVNKLQSTVRDVVYNPTNLSQSTESTVSSFYDSPYHKLLSRTTTLLKDGTIYSTKYKYPQDYTISGTAADDNTAIIKDFQSPYNNSYMTGKIIETTSSIKKPGQADLVVGSFLNKYKTFTVYAPDKTVAGVSTPLLYQQLSLAVASPVNDFSQSTISGGTTLTNDNRYRVLKTFEAYDNKGNVIAESNLQRQKQGAHFDITETKPVLSVTNATANQVAYSGFETISTNSFVYNDNSNPLPVSPGRSGTNSLSLGAGTILKQTVEKGAGQNYILSCWIQTTSPTGTLTVNLSDGTTSVNYTTTYSTNGNNWKYYQIVMPVTSTGQTITAKISTNTSVSIDDVLFFPANSALVYYTNGTYGKTSETDVNGISTFYEYDEKGTIHFIRDADKNTIKRNIYNYKSQVSLAVTPQTSATYTGGSGPYTLTDYSYKVGDQVTFTITNLNQFACLPGTFTYVWDFGDGTSSTSSTSIPQTHTYTHYGDYTYSVTVTSSVYGTQKSFGRQIIFQKEFSASLCLSSGPTVTSICPSIAAFQWDACNPTHSGSIGHNTIQATIIDPYDATPCPVTYVYNWYKCPLGTTNWQPLPQFYNMSSISIDIATPTAPKTTDSYTIRCDIQAFGCFNSYFTSSLKSVSTSVVFIQQSPINSTPCN